MKIGLSTCACYLSVRNYMHAVKKKLEKDKISLTTHTDTLAEIEMKNVEQYNIYAKADKGLC